jgi:hypothetical protein
MIKFCQRSPVFRALTDLRQSPLKHGRKNMQSALIPRFKKTITLGIRKTSDEYRKALRKAGFLFDYRCDETLDKIEYAQDESDVDLVGYNVYDLGFDYDGAHYKPICANGIQMGLELCPAEVGPALRLDYTDQGCDSRLLIAMKPILGHNRRRSIFSVDHGCGGDRWLHFGWISRPIRRPWKGPSTFVFVKPRSR